MAKDTQNINRRWKRIKLAGVPKMVTDLIRTRLALRIDFESIGNILQAIPR